MKLLTLAIVTLFIVLPFGVVLARPCVATSSPFAYRFFNDCAKRSFFEPFKFFNFFPFVKPVYIATTTPVSKAQAPFNKIKLIVPKALTPIRPQIVAPSGTIVMTVDFNAPRTAISPFIYGSNSVDDAKNHGATLIRFGGNRLTAYNWENNASNAGTDWNNQSDGYLGGGDVPGEAVRNVVAKAGRVNAVALVTVPIEGYVARDKIGGVDVGYTPNYLQTRFIPSYPRKNSALALQPDVTDNAVYQDEFVRWLETTFKNSGQTIFYSLDNEPDLWVSTHPRIHPTPVTYQELLVKSVDYASAIKEVAPQAMVFGPVSYGYNGFVSLQNAADASGRDFLNFYLDGMKVAENTYQKRLLDVLDLHWYPEAKGGGERITTDNASPAVQAARIQAPRSLWDKNYKEDSWIANDYLKGPINLLPALQEKIDKHYPGTKIAITEYYYGGGADISGAIAEADVLGIFGRSGVFAANLWRMGATDDRFIYAAFALYRNYDNNGSTFGDISLKASTSNVTSTSVYASTFSGQINQDKLVFVLINKSTEEQKAFVNFSNSDKRYTQAKVYVLTPFSSKLQPGPTLFPASNNTLSYTMSPSSVSVVEVGR